LGGHAPQCAFDVTHDYAPLSSLLEYSISCILHPWRGSLSSLGQSFNCLRTPKVFNLRIEEFERADTVQSSIVAGAPRKPTWSNIVFGGWPVLEYPPSQRPASFSVNQLVDALVKSFESKPKPAAGEERDSDKRTMGVDHLGTS
jgi:hypothetical protein